MGQCRHTADMLTLRMENRPNENVSVWMLLLVQAKAKVQSEGNYAEVNSLFSQAQRLYLLSHCCSVK